MTAPLSAQSMAGGDVRGHISTFATKGKQQDICATAMATPAHLGKHHPDGVFTPVLQTECLHPAGPVVIQEGVVPWQVGVIFSEGREE